MAISDNLVGWWSPSLDDAGNGTTTLTDLTGNGNNGTLTNMDAATDWVSDTGNGGTRALDFDGFDDFVEIPSGFGLVDELAMSFWYQARSTSSSTVFSLGTIGSGSRNIIYGENDDQDLGAFSFLNGAFRGPVRRPANLLTWHHATISISKNSLLRISVDGVISSASRTTPSGINTARIGAFIDSNGRPLNNLDGLVDSVSVFNAPLSDEQITEIYNGGRSLDLLGSLPTLPTNVFSNPVFENPTFRGSTLR